MVDTTQMSRDELKAAGWPYEYDLGDPAEILRLFREVRGYIHTCENQHGTDYKGRVLACHALERLIEAAKVPTVQVARPLSEWHEDHGPVLWWKFPVEEPPYLGTPNDTGFTVEANVSITLRTHADPAGVDGDALIRRDVGGWPGDHTHWTPLPGVPLRPSAVVVDELTADVERRTARRYEKGDAVLCEVRGSNISIDRVYPIMESGVGIGKPRVRALAVSAEAQENILAAIAPARHQADDAGLLQRVDSDKR